MKKNIFLPSMFLASLLFLPIPSQALLYLGDWDDQSVVVSQGADQPVSADSFRILSTRFAHTATDYFFRMDLKSSPAVNGSSYLIDISLSDPDMVDYTLGVDFKGSSFTPSYFSPLGSTDVPFAFLPTETESTSFLEWRISRSEIFGMDEDFSIFEPSSFYFSGSSLNKGELEDWSVASEVTPTPIPGAAWLFASGLAGLAGLRARKKS